jgi:CheY-like chemotaxis protein
MTRNAHELAPGRYGHRDHRQMAPTSRPDRIPMAGRGCPVRVMVVDDDDINRHGMAGLLASDERVAVAATLSHVDAMVWAGDWSLVDVALVDAADDRADGDQFPGVGVVERMRRQASRRLTVVVVTGHFFDDAIRRRMWEAGADFFYHRSELADRRVLLRVVLEPEACRRVPAPHDPDAQFRLGVTGATRVNRAVAHAVERDVARTLAQRGEPRSRRWLRLRRDFDREARLTPMTAGGHLPDRNQDLPALPQIARFLAWATRVKGAPGQRRDDQHPGDRTAP